MQISLCRACVLVYRPTGTPCGTDLTGQRHGMPIGIASQARDGAESEHLVSTIDDGRVR